MENSNNIIESTLEVAHSTFENIDSTLGKIPVYKAGHNVGGMVSSFIDKLANMLPNKL